MTHTKQTIGIAYNLSAEWSPKLSSVLKENPFKTLTAIAEWLLSKDNGKLKGGLETGYASAAAIKSAIDFAYYDNFYLIKKGKQVKLKQSDITLENVFELADLIFKSTMSKFN